jgi:hypothetical protein
MHAVIMTVHVVGLSNATVVQSDAEKLARGSSVAS